MRTRHQSRAIPTGGVPVPCEQALALAVIEDAFHVCHKSQHLGLRLADIEERYIAGEPHRYAQKHAKYATDEERRAAAHRHNADSHRRLEQSSREEAWLFLLSNHPDWVGARQILFCCAGLQLLTRQATWRAIENFKVRMEERRCRECNKLKPAKSFPRKPNERVDHVCRDCASTMYMKAYRFARRTVAA